MENGKCTILWNFTVQTDHKIYGKRPDAIFVQKDKNILPIIDFVSSYDARVDTKKF